jgi:hypothetical protein
MRRQSRNVTAAASALARGGVAPNRHKALKVKRKYFPRERLSTAFSCAGCPNEGSCGGGELSEAIRLGYPQRTRNTHDQPSRRTAPNSHADSGGPAPQGRAAVPETCPGRSRYSFVPSNAAIQQSDWLTPQRECPVRHGWRLGRIVRAMAPSFLVVAIRRGSGGLGMATSQARYFGTALR